MVDRVRNDPRFAEYKQILATLTPETLVQMIQENKPALWQQYRLAEVWDNVKDWSVLAKLQTYYNQGFEKVTLYGLSLCSWLFLVFISLLQLNCWFIYK